MTGMSAVPLPEVAIRAFLGGGIALAVTLALMPLHLRILRALRVVDSGRKGDSKRLDALHARKRNTPTMGGVAPLLGAAAGTFAAIDAVRPGVCMVLGASIALAAVGAWDDLAKLRRSGHGLWPREKMAFLLGIGIVAGTLALHVGTPPANMVVGMIFPLWVGIVVAGTANAVNLTDGLDGLASGCLALAAAGLSIGAAAFGQTGFSEYLGLAHVAPGSDVSILCAALAGAATGFLFFNAHPAQVFMGDTGSLSLGGALALSAVLIRQELLLLIVGGIFVVEAFSVILQVLSFKTRGKRVLLIAPLHHHFEFKGWPEITVTTRFWLCGAVLSFVFVALLLWRSAP
ncbi:MAG TPA: phospho-N-acetylmuramoyl-pentapeptide-transferase [Planctomycetota bacterium]|jgi:phospho-N-acetylmuramoyl-pentapeptide-transferase|nr:phospho-N-acetylmuramoyl-pentapeptide-transferase [Planctomycetota bacterium]OQC20990.1 MAG: Phospho-N-acetylmuramoyl-pentapeptide-transferase [Planctomycetes bacterium ADurb.Bin069]NMD35502.1 phospho-N-acetylmuramoyl-pentapeptide-transferase [Planctomycetota bacterium]HNR98484.1 phospho-N-acetylmuramoyl-pentapeptide-transferase [Planctomycetota bacterium]HNU25096.1 phospho-N-acetylmuramoyl-pentapeptide-transferase [Planctomycetota bacterium]